MALSLSHWENADLVIKIAASSKLCLSQYEGSVVTYIL
jgi:hypothetical protein